MMISRKRMRRAAFAASAGLWTLAGTGQAWAQTQAEIMSEKGSPPTQEIIVTAQKREETLMQIPLSISVVGADTLERRQTRGLKDLLALVPGLNLQSSKPGIGRLVLRGINTGGVSATVGVYVDETPFGSSSSLVDGGILSGDFDTFDVARVEVLRGPQGTLYGASSLGGVLKYVMNEPKFNRFEARGRAGVESTKDGEASYSGTAVINVPLGETLALRASGFYRKYGGYVDAIGTAGSRVKDDINGAKSYGGRISALFKPSDTFSIRLSALLQNLDTGATGIVEVDPAALEPLYGRLSQSQYRPTFSNVRYRLYNGTVNWDLGFADLLSSTSYGTFDLALEGDITLENGAAITEAFGDPVTRPLDMFVSQTTRQRKFTQELRLSSPSDNRFEWLAGAYYTRETGGVRQTYLPFDMLAKKQATGLPLLFLGTYDSVYREYAGFANATWHVTDRLHLSFGGRYSRNEQSVLNTLDGALVNPAVVPEARSAENVFTYSVAPRFELSDNASIYARIAKGYRPGGPNAVSPFASPEAPRSFTSDSLVSYEVGLKADLLDRTFSLDTAAFYLKWKDIQLFTEVEGDGLTDNGKTAVSRGFEFTGTLRPTRGLTVSINGAYTDARLTADTPPNIGGLDGDRLPFTPQWAVSVNGNYEWTISDSVTAFVGGGLRFVGEQSADFDKAYRAAFGRQRVLPSYEEIDLNAGLEFGGWSIEVFVRNLANSRGRTTISSHGDSQLRIPNGAARIGILRPRTIGLTLGTKF